MDRDPFVTADMLRAEGLEVEVEIVAGAVVVSFDDQTAAFPPGDLCAAANWLAELAFINHPESDFAKVWLAIAKAAAAKIPTK